jgi:nicotinamidase-related amidase
LKPKLSAFYATPLDLLLTYLEVKPLILTGVAGNLCVLDSAMDAYMRDYEIIVASDCVASNTIKENAQALAQMKNILKAKILRSTDIGFDTLQSRAPAAPLSKK